MISGYPTYKELENILKPHKKEGSLLIYDDGLNAVNNDIEKIFFQLSHHANSSVIFVSQNMFHASKQHRTISLNTQYLFYMRNPRNKR